MFGELLALLVSVWSHLKEIGGLSGPSKLTLEDFLLELADLGLLGERFGPEEYRAELEKDLGIEILVEELPDLRQGGLVSEVISEGNLAELVYGEETLQAVIIIRESLRYRPWPTYDLVLYHELSHLAAGHHLRAKRARSYKGSPFRRLNFWSARRTPAVPQDLEEFEELKEKVFEPEARKRAKWLVLAGTCPDVLEADKLNRFT